MTAMTTRDDDSGAASTGTTAQRLAVIAAELSDRFLERSSVARALVVAMLAGQHSLHHCGLGWPGLRTPGCSHHGPPWASRPG